MDGEQLYLTLLELGSVGCNIAFLLLLMRERIAAWFWGIIGSLLGALLFREQALFSESMLYIFYAVMGVLGWMQWSRRDRPLRIHELALRFHMVFLLLGAGLTYLLGSFMERMQADKSYYDAFSTVFGVLATFLEIYKVLSGWLYWIGLNVFSIWLYSSKGLYIYAALMAVYTVLSIQGYRQWSAIKKKSD